MELYTPYYMSSRVCLWVPLISPPGIMLSNNNRNSIHLTLYRYPSTSSTYSQQLAKGLMVVSWSTVHGEQSDEISSITSEGKQRNCSVQFSSKTLTLSSEMQPANYSHEKYSQYASILLSPVHPGVPLQIHWLAQPPTTITAS